MDDLFSISSQLKESLTNAVDDKSKEEFIFEHIKTVQKLKYFVDEFPSDLDWFNVSEPLSSSLLQGKIVVLDFFTYCCINCLHIIPHLHQLEENFSVSDGLIVVGVHSAKFENEKDSRNILLALKRYNISHPVINDKDCYLWNKLNISCWPTILILGPNRQPIHVLVGEGHRDELLLFVKAALIYFKNSISSHQLPLLTSDKIITSSLLNFPGKIARWKNIFAVSDSGNHRILVFDEEGFIQFKIGGKTPGFKDGSFETARFKSPQGLTFLDSNTIYIADTENHAIRLANFDTLKVTTVVGNGRQGTDFVGGKIGTLQEISSPWDVCVVPCSDVEVTNIRITAPVSLSGSVSMDKKIPPPLPSGIETISPISFAPASSQCPPLFPPPPPPPFSFTAPTSASSESDSKPPLQNLPKPPPLPLFNPPSCSLKNNLNEGAKVLLIAAAGSHQIWAYFIDTCIWWEGRKCEKNICAAIAGTGKEENRNNRYPTAASFAQPSGLTYSQELKSVFVADSESSTIRRLSLKDGSVTHVAGGGRSPDDLFNYGDVDGKAYDAKLQHPLGVCWNSKQKFIYLCDTYNHKVKKINVSNGYCTSIHKNGNWFSEPSGCCPDESGDFLYVADTNNNCIKMVALMDNDVRKLDLKEHSSPIVADTALKHTWEAETSISKQGGTLTLKIEFSPKEIHGRWRLDIDESKLKVDSLKGKLESNIIEFRFILSPSEIDDVFQIFFDLILCGSEVCASKKIGLKVLVRRQGNAEKVGVCKLTKCLS